VNGAASLIVATFVDPYAPRWLVLGIGIAVLGYIIFSTWRFRWLVRRLFEKHRFDEPTLDQIRAKLATVNRESSKYSFAAQRLANSPSAVSEFQLFVVPSFRTR
jgi:hypothetical protein